MDIREAACCKFGNGLTTYVTVWMLLAMAALCCGCPAGVLRMIKLAAEEDLGGDDGDGRAGYVALASAPSAAC